MLAQNWESFRCSSIHIRDEQLTFRSQKYSQTTLKKFRLYLAGYKDSLFVLCRVIFAVLRIIRNA
jgi:hypothetical protein